MKKRMVLTLTILLGFVAAIGAVKFFQIKAAIAQGASWQPPPEAVTTVVTRVEYWPSSLSAIGSVAAVHGVTVSADLSGIVESIDFESGRGVRAGDVLVRLDTSQERAQLAAAEAQRDLTRLNLERGRQLLEKHVIAQAEYDRMAAEAKEAEARTGEIRATIERKRIRAPFAGVLGIRQVNLGQYLNGGDAVVPLQSMDPIYVDFALPQQDVASLKVGAAVRLSADGIVIPDFEGRITAINSVVDEATRNAQVQATFRNPQGRLRPGMFVKVEASFGRGDSIIALPASAVSYAPYGNSVFVVTQMKGPNGKPYRGVEQRFVRLGPGRGDQVSVLSGLKPGEEVVSSGVFKLRSGAAILVNNKIAPSNNPAPKPEDS
ncbi:MAG: efflux RND transporter periplasmic adaptor subunit [Candidatus Eisenbacteria bacterium]|uniref:Efflux RND transporter periplasmic adaptor subunit n=1 Tax=Eiseniibacteriota bacterium TaxID=2212470 RepID=A0A538TT97_UNCEI|nr:MAG: efflux RND transporter periplasmic adaptor subunit [Candidatus Eisenbacteria bacterium]